MKRRCVLLRYEVMSVPGNRDDGSDTAWFVTDRRGRRGGVHVGDGDSARLRAFARARQLNAGDKR